MSDSNDNVDKETQTRLHAEPHIFNDESERALVTCDKACQTAVTSFPDVEDNVFFSLLEFIPYKDIDQNALRILDLPRKHRLQFKLPEEDEDLESDVSCTDTTKRSSAKRALKRKKFSVGSVAETVETDVQTSLVVLPHVLEEDEVAKIYNNSAAQAAASETDPEADKTVADILSDLITKIKVTFNPDETKCNYYIICASDEAELLNVTECYTCHCTKTCCADDALTQERNYFFCGCSLADLNNVKSALELLILRSTAGYTYYNDDQTQTDQQDFVSNAFVQTEACHYFEYHQQCLAIQTDEQCQQCLLIHVPVQTDEYQVIINFTTDEETNTSTQTSLDDYLMHAYAEKTKSKSTDVSDIDSLKDVSSPEHEVIRLPMIK